MWILADGERDPARVIVWTLVLVGVVLVGFVIVSLVRRWATKSDQTEPAGFTLGDLRQLFKSGKMSQEEFERAKAKIIAAAKRDQNPPAEQESDTGPSR